MSLPAPKVEGRPIATGTPARHRTPPARPSTSSSGSSSASRGLGRGLGRSARPRFHMTFMVFSAAVVSLLVIGVVSLNALLVQTEYEIRSAQQQATRMLAEHEALVNEVARLSSPAKVASWARRQGMVVPRDAVILPIPGSSEQALGLAGTGG